MNDYYNVKLFVMAKVQNFNVGYVKFSVSKSTIELARSMWMRDQFARVIISQTLGKFYHGRVLITDGYGYGVYTVNDEEVALVEMGCDYRKKAFVFAESAERILEE